MKLILRNPTNKQAALPVTWKDSVWLPTVVAKKHFETIRSRRPSLWPVQTISGPTVCRARTLDPIK
jgi:hypothetical protein